MTRAGVDPRQVSNFISLIQGEGAKESIQLCSLPGMRVQHIKSLSELPALSPNYDWYVRVPQVTDEFVAQSEREAAEARARGEKPKMPRGEAFYSSGIGCLWADIDINPGDRKTKKNLPASFDEAHQLLSSSTFKPSLIVNSGRGLHAYWLFHDYWTFNCPEDRFDAALLVRLWHIHVITKFMQGRDVDNVSELARIMRLPGSINQKSKTQAHIFSQSAERYHYSELFNMFKSLATDDDLDEAYKSVQKKTDDDTPGQPRPGGSTGKRSPRSASSVPVATPELTTRMRAALDKNPQLYTTYNFQRTDLKDNSPSGVEMSMITQLVALGWNDEDIIAICIEWRRVKKLQQKTGKGGLIRRDYYENSIKRARSTTFNITRADELFEGLSVELKASPEPVDDSPAQRAQNSKIQPPSTEKRGEMIKFINEAMDTELYNIVRYPADPPRYAIMTATATLTATVDDLIKQDKFKSKMAALTSRLPKTLKPGNWAVIAEMLLAVCTNEDVGLIPTSQIEHWLIDYLTGHPPVKWADRGSVFGGKASSFMIGDNAEHVSKNYTTLSYRDGEAIALVMTQFRTFVKQYDSAKDLAVTAQLAGWYLVPISAEIDKKTITRPFWVAPLPKLWQQ